MLLITLRGAHLMVNTPVATVTTWKSCRRLNAFATATSGLPATGLVALTDR